MSSNIIRQSIKEITLIADPGEVKIQAILVPASLIAELPIDDLRNAKFYLINRHNLSSNQLSDLWIEFIDTPKGLIHWLRAHQLATAFYKLTLASIKIWVERGYSLASNLQSMAEELPPYTNIFLFGIRSHLIVRELGQEYHLHEILKPEIDVNHEVVTAPPTRPLLEISLLPNNIEPPYNWQEKEGALIVFDNRACQTLKNWIIHRPAKIIEQWQTYLDEQFIIIFFHGQSHPPLSFGQSLVRQFSHQQRSIYLPYNYRLMPRLPAKILFTALQVSDNERLIICNGEGGARRILIPNSEIKQLMRAMFK